MVSLASAMDTMPIGVGLHVVSDVMAKDAIAEKKLICQKDDTRQPVTVAKPFTSIA